MIIPQKLLDKHPDLTKNEIKLIARTIIIGRADKIRNAYIVNFTVLGMGKFRSHARKKNRRWKKGLTKDRKRKRELTIKKQMSRESLLF